MGRRLAALAVLAVAVGCSSSPEDVPTASSSAAPAPGVETHKSRGQINPNASMPAAGSKAGG